MSASARIFSIPSGCAFLPTLVDALRRGDLVGPLAEDAAALADITFYVPTRRAASALLALLARPGDKTRLLPRIVPLGEADDGVFEPTGLETPSFDDTALQPPIPPLERRLILTRLVQRWSREIDRTLLRIGPDVPFLVPASPADAVNLAGDLEALMDSFTTEGIDWHALGQAVDADYSTYFEITRRFVAIASENWPRILADRQMSDPAQRRGVLIETLARRLSREAPTAPMIVAGSTGSVPATAALMAAVARLPRGAVVLPGLDGDLDEESWAAIGRYGYDEISSLHSHPQASLQRLLEKHLRVSRSEVRSLGSSTSAAEARHRLLSQALRPADTTDRWALMPQEQRIALSRSGCIGLMVVEAADEREEALAIAIALRETLADPSKTAAFITPDRALAVRVTAELVRWGVTVEDSAGVPLTETSMGRLARLVAEAAADDLRPVRLLSLLAHPLIRLGWPRSQVERAAGILEIGVLRGPMPGPGLAGMRAALAFLQSEADRHTPRPRARITQEDWALADLLLQELQSIFETFLPPARDEELLDLVALAQAHCEVLERLAQESDDEVGTTEDNTSREAIRVLFDDLALSETDGVMGRFADYPSFFTAIARQRTIQLEPRFTHRRIKILGLLEARLLSVDRVVLGGLDEGIWPPRTMTDAFLNRPMRSKIGLMPPERRIGQTAHDFVQALGTSDAVITRAQKRDGSPMVPSRFLQRLRAFTGEETWNAVTKAGERYRHLARALDMPLSLPTLARPRPKPDPALFPKSLSVTEIETLVRDPYSIFARHILRLDPLDNIAVAPSAAKRGTIIHTVLGDFASVYPKDLPDYALEDLLGRGAEAFNPVAVAYPELYAEWWPRFQRLAGAFVVWEQNRRPDLAKVFSERSGQWTFPLKDSVFTLRARADRIEQHRDGSFTIIDFKTGQPPGLREVYAGFAPQLTLEAIILMQGGFGDIPPARETPDLLYVHTTGGPEPLKPRGIEPNRGENRSTAEIVEEHRRRFTSMIARYASGEAAFISRPFPKYARRFSDYDHLARVREWSLTGAGDGEDSD